MALEFRRVVKNNEKHNELILDGSRFKIGLNVDRGYTIDGDSKSIYGTIDLIMDDSIIGRATFNHKINPKGEPGVVYAFSNPGAFGCERVIKNKDIFFIHEVKNKSKAIIKTALRNGKPYYTVDGDTTSYLVKYKYGCIYKYIMKVTPLEIRVNKRLVTLSKIEERYQKGFDFIHSHIFKLTDNVVYHNRNSVDEKFKLNNMYHNTKYKAGYIISQSNTEAKIIAFGSMKHLRNAPAEEIYKNFEVGVGNAIRVCFIYYEGVDMFIDYLHIKPKVDIIPASMLFNVEIEYNIDRKEYKFEKGDLSSVITYKEDKNEIIEVDKFGYVSRVYEIKSDNTIHNKLVSDNEYAISLDAPELNIRLQHKYKFGEEIKCLCSLPVSGNLLDDGDATTAMNMVRLFLFSDYEVIKNGLLKDSSFEQITNHIVNFYQWYDKIVNAYYQKDCKTTYKAFREKFAIQMRNYMEMMRKAFGDEIQSFRFYIKMHDSVNVILCCESFHFTNATEHKTLRMEFVTNIKKNRLDKYSDRIPEEVTTKRLDGVSTSTLKATTRYTLLPNRVLKGLSNTAINYQSKDALMVDLYNLIVERYSNSTKDYDISKDEVFDIINHL